VIAKATFGKKKRANESGAWSAKEMVATLTTPSMFNDAVREILCSSSKILGTVKRKLEWREKIFAWSWLETMPFTFEIAMHRKIAQSLERVSGISEGTSLSCRQLLTQAVSLSTITPRPMKSFVDGIAKFLVGVATEPTFGIVTEQDMEFLVGVATEPTIRI
jgi:hypothetical protein